MYDVVAPIQVYCDVIPYYGTYLASHLGGCYLGANVGACRPGCDGVSIGCYWDRPDRVARFTQFASRCRRVFALFAGTDITMLSGMAPAARSKLLSGFRNVIYATDGGKARAGELTACGASNVVQVKCPPRVAFPLKPFPTGDLSVACYGPESRQEFYRLGLMIESAKIARNARFFVYHMNGWKKPPGHPGNMVFLPSGITDMGGFLARMHCSLRFPIHDSCSMSSIEMLMAGRYVIGDDANMPYVIITGAEPEEVAKALNSVQSLVRENPGGFKEASAYYHKTHGPGQFKDAVFQALSGCAHV